MPGSFWFEERGTEKYYSHPKKDNYYTDWNKKIFHTKEEYEAQRANRGLDEQTIWRKGDTTGLQLVDELICEFMGEPAPSIDRDSKYFYLCHEWGFVSLFRLGGEYVEERHVEWIKAQLRDWNESQTDDKKVSEVKLARTEALLDWVFLKKWRFHATG